MQEWALPVWRNIMKCTALYEGSLGLSQKFLADVLKLRHCAPTDDLRQPQLIVRWLANLLTETSQPQMPVVSSTTTPSPTAVVLAQAFAAVTFEVLGPRIMETQVSQSINLGPPTLWCEFSENMITSTGKLTYATTRRLLAGNSPRGMLARREVIRA